MDVIRIVYNIQQKANFVQPCWYNIHSALESNPKKPAWILGFYLLQILHELQTLAAL